MKKLLLVLIMGFVCPLFAEMKKDPVTNKFYSIPAAPDINQEEYGNLLFICWQISGEITKNPAYKNDTQGCMVGLITEFLHQVGSSTAFRVLDDLRELTSDIRYSRHTL